MLPGRYLFVFMVMIWGINSVPAHAETIHVTIDKFVFSPEELGQSSWLVAGNIPGISRQLAKKLNPDHERAWAEPYRSNPDLVPVFQLIYAAPEDHWPVMRYAKNS
jgi:hypothetical protein